MDDFEEATVPLVPEPIWDRSADVGELMDALAKAQGEFAAATKDSKNPYYDSRYADLATIIGAVRPAMAKHGLVLIHNVGADLQRQTATAKAYIFKGNQYISAEVELPAVGKAKDGKDRFDAQTIGAAQTYARRYSAAALLGIAQEDDDGNTVVRDDARKVENRTTPAQAEKQAAARFDRSKFLTKAKELGWSMGDIKSYCIKAYNIKASGDMTDAQMEAALLIFAKMKPTGEVIENQDAEPQE